MALSPAPAHAEPTTTPTAEPCQVNALDVSAESNPVAMAYAPGQAAIHPASIHNGTSSTFSDTFFDFGLIPSSTGNPGTAPAVSWSIDGGAWHGLSLGWVPRPAPNQSYWQSADTALPTLSPGSTHTLRFSVSFHADNPTGFYQAPLSVGARSCVYQLGATFAMEYDFYTDAGPTGCCVNGGSRPSSGGSTGTTAGGAASSPAPASPSAAATTPPASPPSDSASPAAASPVPVARVTTVSRTTGWVWTGWIGLAALVTAGMVGWFVRRTRRPGNPSSEDSGPLPETEDDPME